ncbi:hypothetical protein CVT24_005929 [Panaeolus cyanescens]|uniref:AAA+ ATPase domain-containing protein n=1 Tax=Panaeolus cyanescens TaxID=181874 RepID=A0A409V8Y0_9AGAR|nr:hypothetical protein CVT24_005929 [Panaeolus cyanescens]
MRSSSLLLKSQSLIRHSTLIHPSHPIINLRNQCSLRNVKRPRLLANDFSGRRSLSSAPVPPPAAEEPSINGVSGPTVSQSASGASVDTSIPSSDDSERSGARTRRSRVAQSSSSSRESTTIEFPEGLSILSIPEESIIGSDDEHVKLPPPEIFEEALDNLLITLHPQNQHRAVNAPPGTVRPIEPTLALYCPIEGGDYVIDATVQELAFKTGSEVLTLDAAQLAAGEFGQFGPAAQCLNLPKNPLHIASPTPTPPENTRPLHQAEEEEEEGMPFLFPSSAKMSISIPRGATSLQSRALLTPSSRRTAPPSKLEVFFDSLVNYPSSSSENIPRLIYIRDFPLLAPSSSLWYPALLSAIRNRRRGAVPSPSNLSPVTIIFGMTPPLSPPLSDGASGSTSNLMNLLMTRNNMGPRAPVPSKHETFHDWTESEAAELAREKRLRSRLKKWQKDSASFHHEIPKLSSLQDSDGGSKPEIVVIGGGEGGFPLPPMMGMPVGVGVGEPERDSSAAFFRTSVIVPGNRSTSQERNARVARRKELNELIMRMGIGAVGGSVESTPVQQALELETSAQPTGREETAPPKVMWDDWGNKLEAWSNVRKIADRAMGSIMAANRLFDKRSKTVLDPTPIPWSAVQSAWLSFHAMHDVRKHWFREMPQSLSASDLSEQEQAALDELPVDKVIEGIKNDPDLEQHEQRLLPCIVDSNSITTSFNQVHLPTHTIDSVRTIVSLPLLYPHAFQQGILKEHSMTGCLLFGPPGTGKTLVVRALAKEAGCRMLAVSPSDVMDMYVGEGEKLVKAVFSLARRLSPCVVFLDEIDALFGARMSARESGSAFAHRGVITEFMQEMDGLKSSKDDNVIVIGATNRPFDLDDAVLRRLPRRLLVDLPGENERKEILRILLRDEVLAPDVTVEYLSRKTDSFSGSDLKHLCVAAALDSVKEHIELPWKTLKHEKQGVPPVNEPTDSLPTTEEINPTNEAVDLANISTEHSNEVTRAIVDGTLPHVDENILKAGARVLALRHFTQALKEITPSSSESLGSLNDLRKWNEEFGEGRKGKKHQVWGKGRFGFINVNQEPIDEGKVSNA